MTTARSATFEPEPHNCTLACFDVRERAGAPESLIAFLRHNPNRTGGLLMDDQKHVIISLTFKTPKPGRRVIADVIEAINAHTVPYDLTSISIAHFDADDPVDEITP